MPDQPTFFGAQEQHRADARQGQKVVFTDMPVLPDGRYDGQGDWSREALLSKQRREGLDNDRERALLMLYRHRRIDSDDFYDVHDSMRLSARIEELRHDIDEAPPIRTDDSGPGRADYFIPEAE